MSKNTLKLCRQLDRRLDDMRKVLEIYTDIYPTIKDTIDNHFDELYNKAHEVIGKHDVGVCQDTNCNEIWLVEDLDQDGICENCRDDQGE